MKPAMTLPARENSSATRTARVVLQGQVSVSVACQSGFGAFASVCQAHHGLSRDEPHVPFKQPDSTESRSLLPPRGLGRPGDHGRGVSLNSAPAGHVCFQTGPKIIIRLEARSQVVMDFVLSELEKNPPAVAPAPASSAAAAPAAAPAAPAAAPAAPSPAAPAAAPAAPSPAAPKSAPASPPKAIIKGKAPKSSEPGSGGEDESGSGSSSGGESDI